jgi:hypothetical protein
MGSLALSAAHAHVRQVGGGPIFQARHTGVVQAGQLADADDSLTLATITRPRPAAITVSLRSEYAVLPSPFDTVVSP